MPSVFDTAALNAFARRHAIDPHRIKRMQSALLRRYLGPDGAIAELPAESRDAFQQAIQLRVLQLDSRHDSALDGATKLIFRTHDALRLESVILRLGTGRTALCLSTQVGCAARCEFCATGYMGLNRQLTAAEILDQVVQAGELARQESRRIRNLVLMGMGEPLHNEEQVYAALDELQQPSGLAFSPQRILLSTVGVPEAMVRCARRYPQLRLALSLHSARQEIRERLIPVAKKHPLPALRTAMAEAIDIQQHGLLIEYLLLSGVNDSVADADALIAFLSGLRVHVNLIPYNTIDDAPQLTGTAPAERALFSDRLKAAGLKVTTRYSLGADIAAACGQLIRKDQRRATSLRS